MKRLWTVFAGLILIFSIIEIRLWYWQIASGDKLRAEAAAQYYLEFSLPAERGTMEASDGHPLVLNAPAFLAYATPNEITNKKQFADVVSPITDWDSKELFSALSVPNRLWVPIAHKLDSSAVGELKDKHLKGLGFEKETKRYYPEASMAGQILGFVGSDQNGNNRGYFGLEGYYDRELRGKDGKLKIEKDVKGAPILLGEAKRIEPEHGRNLTLSIDRTVQYIVERELLGGIRKYGAKEGSVVVMDPSTGGILAAASYPTYDSANFTKFDKALYKNPIVASSYEPGSTFKTIIMSAALDKKVITPATETEETGPIQIGEYAIETWNKKYHGTINMTAVLEHSSNTGMVFVEKKLGKQALLDSIHAFGFGEPTGVDVEGEEAPALRGSADWYEIDLAAASFGQGIAVTPIQMVRAVAVLANGGFLMEPHVVKSITDSKGKVIEINPKKVRQVVSSATAGIITEMMVAAVDNGEAKWAKPMGYRIAGKTGTAQIAVAGHYDEKKTIASFVGFAPADHPRFVMLVTLSEPSSSPWGSETAAPLFFSISRDLFAYWGIPPQ